MAFAPDLPSLSRALLTPGAQPPLSHLGVTLLRHVVGTVLRYSHYQLALPMPDAPPVRILRLRLYLDAVPLGETLSSDPAGPAVIAALLDPGGAGDLDPSAARVRSAAALHRARLAALGPRHGRPAAGAGSSPPAPPPVDEGPSFSEAIPVEDAQAVTGSASAAAAAPATSASVETLAATGIEAAAPATRHHRATPVLTREELWKAVGATLSGRMPYLCDAGLGELVAALARRRKRLQEREVRPALGQVAWLVHRERDADLRALGVLDPFAPSWAETAVPPQELRARAQRARDGRLLPQRPGRRGAFREAYRWVLSEVRPLLLELGARAREEGIVDDADDVFFLPFDLGAELAGAHRPSWLAAAVAANRREHRALATQPEHDDVIHGSPAHAPAVDRSSRWDVAPLETVV